MALTPGGRLGPYEIVCLLGAGGMGEVYRARDTKLNRDVALKVLPPEVAGDPDRLMRLQREAQLLASLNHPNIAQIHGFEDATVPALAMELVEGRAGFDRGRRGLLSPTIERDDHASNQRHRTAFGSGDVFARWKVDRISESRRPPQGACRGRRADPHRAGPRSVAAAGI